MNPELFSRPGTNYIMKHIKPYYGANPPLKISQEFLDHGLEVALEIL